ncbi:MAG TPA: TlpA disulfide reductase family protein [Candidatus Dormibacteraeota bacterium]|nr:TlpA disulfide reductase family protein [Candidatus Dormibacteraeota bacterium]
MEEKQRKPLLFLARWLAIATVAVGIGVVAGKSIPRQSHASLASIVHAFRKQSAPSSQKQGVLLKFVKDPEPVPSFSVRSLTGQTLDPAEWKGKVVILNFWATWCTPCRFEIPELESLQKRFQGSLQVVGLSVDDGSASQVQAFVKSIGFDYPVAMASEQLQDEFGGILALPTSFVINRDGRVVQKHVGLVPADYYAAEISYLAGKPPAGVQVKTFVDEGQVFPSNVTKAKSLPGVDMSHLNAAQRKAALTQMNKMNCTCGCGYTVAQCRLLDPSCQNSKSQAQAIVAQSSHPASSPSAATGKAAASL